MADKASPQARKKQPLTILISHWHASDLSLAILSPHVLDALNQIMAHKDCSKAMAIKIALVEYAKTLD